MFIPVWGNDPNWLKYFADGLKPPGKPLLGGTFQWMVQLFFFHGDRKCLRDRVVGPFPMRKNEHQATDAFATSDCILGGG